MKYVVIGFLMIMIYSPVIGKSVPQVQVQANSHPITNSVVKPDTLLSSKHKDGTPGANIAVRICVPSKSELLNPPLYVIKTHNKEFKVKNIGIINPNAIQSIDILKDTSAVNKYGDEAKNGVVLITVNDEKYPELYKEIKKAYKERNKSAVSVNP